MQNLSNRIDQLINIQKGKPKKDFVPQSVLARRIIAKNQEILCAAAARVYNLHEAVRIKLWFILETLIGFNNLIFGCFLEKKCVTFYECDIKEVQLPSRNLYKRFYCLIIVEFNEDSVD